MFKIIKIYKIDSTGRVDYNVFNKKYRLIEKYSFQLGGDDC